MIIDSVTWIAYIVQYDKVDIAYIEGIVLGSEFSSEGVEGMLVTGSIKIQVMISSYEVLGYLANGNNFLKAGIERQVISHHVTFKD
jgi:hypothetical protein